MVNIKQGSKLARRDVARLFESVPGTLISGRRITSKVAFEGTSEASLTSIGPEMDASATVSPIFFFFRSWEGKKRKERKKKNSSYRN